MTLPQGNNECIEFSCAIQELTSGCQGTEDQEIGKFLKTKTSLTVKLKGS